MSHFQGFTTEDFNVFTVDGLDARMAKIKKHVRPKLELLGQHFATDLTAMTGDDIHSHVAQHARRTVNPPDDTWVAFAANARGYKKHPHFQIGLWGTHVFIWFAVINETLNKDAFARILQEQQSSIRDNLPKHFMWSVDHTKPDAIRNDELSDSAFAEMLDRLKNVKKAELLCGIHIPKERAEQLSGDETLQVIEKTFKQLIPLYELARKRQTAS